MSEQAAAKAKRERDEEREYHAKDMETLRGVLTKKIDELNECRADKFSMAKTARELRDVLARAQAALKAMRHNHKHSGVECETCRDHARALQELP